MLVFFDQANIFQYSVQYGGKNNSRENTFLALDPFQYDRVQSCPSDECLISITLPDAVVKVELLYVSLLLACYFVHECNIFDDSTLRGIVEQEKSRVHVYYQLTGFHQNHRWRREHTIHPNLRVIQPLDTTVACRKYVASVCLPQLAARLMRNMSNIHLLTRPSIHFVTKYTTCHHRTPHTETKIPFK